MSITQDFKEIVQERALRDSVFREGLLREKCLKVCLQAI